ncbi:PKD domain-containing protein [Candidatus Parcubacteria bacterium]|nr:PKD domain-containing protein [Candidatus Parcubacteria bacterium]
MKKTKGQGVIEALILILGIIFIFAIALPGASSRLKVLQVKTSREQNQTASLSQNEDLPLCGDIIAIPSSQGKAPFRVFLVGTEKQGRYKISGFRWDFTGNGSWDTEVTKEPQNYVFETPGDYNLKMLVIDERDNSQTCNQTIVATE